MLSFFIVFLTHFLLVSALNETFFSRSLLNKETVQIVSYNNINGYLNWHEDFFKEFISNKCQTNCLFSTNPSDVNKINSKFTLFVILLTSLFI